MLLLAYAKAIEDLSWNGVTHGSRITKILHQLQ